MDLMCFSDIIFLGGSSLVAGGGGGRGSCGAWVASSDSIIYLQDVIKS